MVQTVVLIYLFFRINRLDGDMRMERTWILLLHVYISLGMLQWGVNSEDEFLVPCGKYKMNGYKQYCIQNSQRQCSGSICNLPESEDSRQQCQLYCGRVLEKLRQLPHEIQEKKQLQKAVNDTRERRRLRIDELTEEMAAKDVKQADMQGNLLIFQVLTAVFMTLFAVLVIFNIIFICRKRFFTTKPPGSPKNMEESESLFSKYPATVDDTKDSRVSGVTSASRTTGGVSKDSGVNNSCAGQADTVEEMPHPKCGDFNRIQPANDRESANPPPVVPSHQRFCDP